MADVPGARQYAARIDERWDFDDPVASEAAFRRLLEDPGVTPAGELALQVHTQIARALALQRRFDEAHAVLDGVEADLGEEHPVEPSLVPVRLGLERGRVFNSAGAPDRAAPLFEAAWDEAGAIGAEFYAIDAAHMLAIVAPPEEALRWNERALAAATSAREDRARGWIGSLCNNIGWTYHALERFDEALAMFERALDARRVAGKSKDIRVARWCVARCLRSLGRTEEALTGQRALEAELDAAGEEDGFVPEEIAECLYALGREDDARPYFRRAFERLSGDAWLAEAEPDRLARLRRLGDGS